MTSYQLEFGYSTSVRYPRALELFGQIVGGTTRGTGRYAVHAVTFGDLAEPGLRELLVTVAPWSSASVRRAGLAAPAGALQRAVRVAGCASGAAASLFREQYCWGPPFVAQRVPCRLLEEALPWARLDEPATDWTVLVGRIAEERLLGLCPLFEAAAVVAELGWRARRERWRISEDPVERLFGFAALGLDARWRSPGRGTGGELGHPGEG